MQQKFNLEAAGRLLGISASAVRARAKKNPDKYGLERDNRGRIFVWIDPERIPDLQPSKVQPMRAETGELKATIQAMRNHGETVAADLQAQIAALRDDLAAARLAAAVSAAECRAAVALSDDRARALAATERNLSDLRRLLPSAVPARRRWWPF